MFGIFDGIDYGYDYTSQDKENFYTKELSLNDIVNCAEAMLINSFKPKLNQKFKNNL